MRAGPNEAVVIAPHTGWYLFLRRDGLEVEIALQKNRATVIRANLWLASAQVSFALFPYGSLPRRQRIYRPDLKQPA
jgi:hypothetical protein